MAPPKAEPLMADQNPPDTHAKEEAFLQSCLDAVDSLLNAKDVGKQLYGIAVADQISELVKAIHRVMNDNVPGFSE